MESYLIRSKGFFMTQLLSSGCFDSFLLEEATIRMAVTYHIDGRLNRDFYDTDVWNDPARTPGTFIPWSDIRPYCHDCIRGKQAPASFQFVLRLKPAYIPASLGDTPDSTKAAVSSLAISIHLPAAAAGSSPAERGIHLVTGISYSSFVLDRSAEAAWDHTMERFLAAKGFDFEKQ